MKMKTTSSLPVEFVEDVDLEALSRSSKPMRRLVFDKIVRQKLQERNKERAHSFLLTPQRRTRIQLAEINVIKGSPGIHRRLIEGDYIGSECAVSNFNAYADIKKEFVRQRLTRALERRPSSENVMPVVGVSSALVPKILKLQRAMTSDVLRKKLRRQMSVPADIVL